MIDLILKCRQCLKCMNEAVYCLKGDVGICLCVKCVGKMKGYPDGFRLMTEDEKQIRDLRLKKFMHH